MLNKLKNLLGQLGSKTSDSPKSSRAANIKAIVIKHSLISISILFACYIGASAAGSLAIPVIVGTIGQYRIKQSDVPLSPVNLRGRPNFHSVRKNILKRNVFSLTGEFPEETEEFEDQNQNRNKNQFNSGAPCTPSSLKLTLIGTIFLGNESQSIATIKEAGFEEVDVYRSGDLIIGNDDAQIVNIERNRVVINNLGKKECLEIKLADGGRGSIFQDSISSQAAEKVGDTVLLRASFVESELGDGFGKVIQSARLVPNTVDNNVNGFKIFAIRKKSLLEKIGLKNGDVITQVNGTVMTAEQGFALYQALLDERDITIRILRGGKDPKTLHTQIK